MNLALVIAQLVMEISVFSVPLGSNIMREVVKAPVQLCTTAVLLSVSHVQLMEIVLTVLVLLAHFAMMDLR